MIQYTVTRLEKDEYDVLTKIAKKTKCDCWFSLKTNDRGQDIVYDLERNEELPLYDGIYDLIEALDCQENYDACDLNAAEEYILGQILNTLGIIHPGYKYNYEYWDG